MTVVGSITDVPGIRVGHASDFVAVTGCTVVLFDRPATGAIDLRGGGTATRQVDSLMPHNTFGKIWSILLTGGSAYGLDASSGAMKYLEEREMGLDVGYGFVVPSVPTAVIFDLGIGDGSVRPDKEMGYEACMNADSSNVAEGSVGVGTGATIGKLFGVARATKGGIGTSSYWLPNSVTVGVLVAVNAFGDVIDPENGNIIAGMRNSPDGTEFPGTTASFKQGVTKKLEPYQNTSLAVVATDARFSKTELMRVSAIAETGLSRVISPSHTASDGDVVFAVSCGEVEGDANAVGIVAAELISEAIIKAVKNAVSLGGIPSQRDLVGRS